MPRLHLEGLLLLKTIRAADLFLMLAAAWVRRQIIPPERQSLQYLRTKVTQPRRSRFGFYAVLIQ
jgi:hypothetical protein